MIGAAARGDTDRQRLRRLFQLRGGVGKPLQRRACSDRKHRVFVRQQRQRRVIGVALVRDAGDEIGIQRSAGDGYVMRITGALVHIGKRYGLIATRLVDNVQRHQIALTQLHHFLDRARHRVGAAAGCGR